MNHLNADLFSTLTTGWIPIYTNYFSLTVRFAHKIQILSQPFCMRSTNILLLHLTQITWIDGNGNVLTANVAYGKEPSPDNRLQTAKSILKLKAKREHHNKTIHCQAQNSADKTYRSASIRLEVSTSRNNTYKVLFYV